MNERNVWIFITFALCLFTNSTDSFTLWRSVGGTFSLQCNQLSFKPFWSLVFLYATHLITFIFCYNCMGKISPLILSVCQITIGERVWKGAMCAVYWEKKKKAHTPVEDKQGFQSYDRTINLVQDMNCSVILMVKEALHSGTVGAERHVLHTVNCLAAGIPRSATPSTPEPSQHLLPPRLISCL